MLEKDKLNLISMLEAANKIIRYVKPYPAGEKLYENERDFDAVLMNFIVIGELSARLSSNFVIDYPDIDWAGVKGFRNMIAHDYFGVDADEVWEIILIHLPELVKRIEEIINTK